jgi:putative transcriptional regulator
VTESTKGRLLVAAPSLSDPNFRRTVVMMLEHDDAQGALGVVLNRPSFTEVAGPLPEWEPVAAFPDVFFLGGPVTPGNVIGLARVWPEAEGEGVTPLIDRLAVVDLNRAPTELGAMVEEARAFAGCAGWGVGQLEAEIGVGAWFVVDALADDALSPEPEELWAGVLRRQGGRLAMFSTFPPELSMN